MSAALAEKIEVWGFEEGSLIYKDLSLGAILRLRTRDVSCATDEELNSLHHVACDFLNGLPSGLSLQFVQGIHNGAVITAEKHRSLSTAEAQPLATKMAEQRFSRISQLDKVGEAPQQSLYLVVRKPLGAALLGRGLYD